MEYLTKFLLNVNLQNSQPLISLNIRHRLNDPGLFLYITFFQTVKKKTVWLVYSKVYAPVLYLIKNIIFLLKGENIPTRFFLGFFKVSQNKGEIRNDLNFNLTLA